MNEQLLNYMKWADMTIIKLLRTLSAEQLKTNFNGMPSSIHDKLKHLAEEYYAWLLDLKQEDWGPEIKQLSNLDSKQLMSKIDDYHLLWKQYLQNSPKTQYEIDEGNDRQVNISLDGVVFNLVNHSSYHRGQIVFMLRNMEIKTPITDYYWYLIHKQKK